MIVSARVNILFKVFCCVDRVHLKKNEKTFKSGESINTVFLLTRHTGIILIQIFVSRKERLIFIHNAFPIPSGTAISFCLPLNCVIKKLILPYGLSLQISQLPLCLFLNFIISNKLFLRVELYLSIFLL